MPIRSRIALEIQFHISSEKKKSHKDLIQRCSAQSVSVKCFVRHQLKKAAHNWCHITTAYVVSALIFLKMYIIRFVGLVLIFCCLPWKFSRTRIYRHGDLTILISLLFIIHWAQNSMHTRTRSGICCGDGGDGGGWIIASIFPANYCGIAMVWGALQIVCRKWQLLDSKVIHRSSLSLCRSLSLRNICVFFSVCPIETFYIAIRQFAAHQRCHWILCATQFKWCLRNWICGLKMLFFAVYVPSWLRPCIPKRTPSISVFSHFLPIRSGLLFVRYATQSIYLINAALILFSYKCVHSNWLHTSHL